MLSKIVQLIYPEPVKCVECRKVLEGCAVEIGLCPECLSTLHLFTGKASVEIEGRYYDSVHGAALYDGQLKEWIHRLKYYGDRGIVFPLVEVLYRQYNGALWDGIIPVPLHEERLQERGYNQALLLAQGLAMQLQLPCNDWLVRVKGTLPQNRLKVSERMANLHGAFALRNEAQVAGRNWLIFDDIFTTGSTVNEVARVLKEAGANSVGVYVLASGRLM